jgi:putative GTP pyrophosphokinase
MSLALTFRDIQAEGCFMAVEQMDSSNISVDLDNHGQRALEEYKRVRQLYANFVDCVKSILIAALNSQHIKVASIEGRAKDEESFRKKASKPSTLDLEQPKYRYPMIEITDLAGIRVITFLPKTLHQIKQIIYSQFNVTDEIDKAEILMKEDKFGYQSIHYLITLKQDRLSLAEYAAYRGLTAEIQVRTILQHAWAEIEHDIQYKSLAIAPTTIRRRFMSLAGLFEIADREFQAIQDEDEQIRQEARKSVQEDKFESVEITPDALKAYLDKKLGADGRMKDWSYQWTATLLHDLWFTNFSQIDECIKGYDDDILSRIIYRNRTGQLTRFETLLLAGMGENYIKRHPWSKNTDWFTPRHLEYLNRLEKQSVKIGQYQPPEK